MSSTCNEAFLSKLRCKLRVKVRVYGGLTHIADDRYFSDAVQDIKPDTNVLCSVGNGSSDFTHELVRVNSDLKDVVGESEERSQRECSHEDGDEAELKNCAENMT